MLPVGYQESFGNLIDMYYTDNNEILSEYKNPMESFNKVIAGIHSKKNQNSTLLENVAEKLVSKYKYTIMLGMTEQSEKEKTQCQEELSVLFGEVGNSINVTDIWEQIEELFLKYSTGNSDDEGFKNYVLGQAQYLFNHMKKCWKTLLR